MSLLRCSKCGSDSGFLIETSTGSTLTVKGKLPSDRIRNTVHVTCTYCNAVWDHVPMRVTDPRVGSTMGRTVQH